MNKWCKKIFPALSGWRGAILDTGRRGPNPRCSALGLALWGGFCLSRIFMFYLILFYLFFFQRAVDHDFSRHIYVPKFVAKVLPPRGRVCGRAVRCVWKSIRSLLPSLSTVLREISQSPEKAPSPACAFTIKNQSRHYDKWALCKHVRKTDGRIFVDNFMSI